MECINVERRKVNEKAKKMRQKGLVPGNIFGKTIPESISIQIDEATARKVFREKNEGSKLMLEMDGKSIPVQIKEKIFDAMKNEISHISFQVLNSTEVVNSVIHILIANDEKVTGQLERMIFEIPYASLPENMIDTITIDLEGIKMGTVLTVKDIPELMDEKIELKINQDEIVLRLNERKNNIRLQPEK